MIVGTACELLLELELILELLLVAGVIAAAAVATASAAAPSSWWGAARIPLTMASPSTSTGTACCGNLLHAEEAVPGILLHGSRLSEIGRAHV